MFSGETAPPHEKIGFSHKNSQFPHGVFRKSNFFSRQSGAPPPPFPVEYWWFPVKLHHSCGKLELSGEIAPLPHGSLGKSNFFESEKLRPRPRVRRRRHGRAAAKGPRGVPHGGWWWHWPWWHCCPSVARSLALAAFL